MDLLNHGTCAVARKPPLYSTRSPTPSLGTTPSSSTARSPHHRAGARRGQPQEIEVEIGDVDHELEEELTWRVRYAPWHPTGFIRGPMGI